MTDAPYSQVDAWCRTQLESLAEAWGELSMRALAVAWLAAGKHSVLGDREVVPFSSSTLQGFGWCKFPP